MTCHDKRYILGLEIDERSWKHLAKIEIRCTDEFKAELKHYVKGKDSDVSKYVKAAIYEKRIRDININKGE